MSAYEPNSPFERIAELAGGFVVILAEAFIDESGTHDGSPMMTVAGYLFRQHQAKRFSRDWHKVLEKYGVRAAHQTDCALGFGDYKHLSKDERIMMTRLLIENIKRRTMFGFGVSVDPAAYDRIVGKENNAPCAYSFALMGVLTIISRWVRDNQFDARVTFVFESGHASQSEAGRFIDLLMSNKKSWFRRGYAGHAFLDKLCARELQAADMLAWQYQHHHARQKQGVNKIRADFAALLRPQDVCIEHNDETLLRFRHEVTDGGWLVDRY